jgi:hypothetical protein
MLVLAGIEYRMQPTNKLLNTQLQLTTAVQPVWSSRRSVGY